MMESGSNQGEQGSDTAAEAARLFAAHQASGITAVGGASGEITAPSTSGEYRETTESDAAARSDQSPVARLAERVLTTVADATDARDRYAARADELGGQIAALEEAQARLVGQHEAGRLDGTLRQGRADLWGVVEKTGGRYAHGAETVRAAIALSPHNDQAESLEVLNARVEAAEAASAQISQGVPTVMQIWDQERGIVFVGAIPDHDGLSITSTWREGDTRFKVGVNGIGVPISEAWTVRTSEGDVEMSQPPEVIQNFQLLTGDGVPQALNDTCRWYANYTALNESADLTDPAVAARVESVKYRALSTMVTAVNAAKKLDIPIDPGKDRQLVMGGLQEHLFTVGDQRPHNDTRLLRTGEALRYLYPAEGGEQAMIADVVAGSQARHRELYGQHNWASVVHVLQRVCNLQDQGVIDALMHY